MSPRSLVAIGSVLLVLAGVPSPPPRACEICAGLGPGSGPNVAWFPGDSVSVCPAGDSLIYSHHPAHLHPSKLRVEVWYNDINCNPKPNIPPDSIWITYETLSGNVVVYDQGVKVFADDSTDFCGFARVTFPSLSGCGTLRLRLFDTGVYQGLRDVVVRSTDTNGNGRVATSGDVPVCDLDYSGGFNLADNQIFSAHQDHWHRNALHGTLMRRTNHCETCAEGSANTKGLSEISWSPSQRYIAYTAFIDASPDPPSCKVFLVPSDPAQGNALTQFTFTPLAEHDYDPIWSPTNEYIVFDREDREVIRKPPPWQGTAETVVTTSNNPGCDLSGLGDIIPAVSPNGQWVAFSRCNPGASGWSIWKIPITGGTATQLTPAAARADFYASWSADGQTIYFQRRDDAVGPGETAWKVPAAGGTAQQVFVPPASPISHVVQPATSPDDKILLMGFGPDQGFARSVLAHTLDPALSSPVSNKVIANYADTTFAAAAGESPGFPILSPRLSPDGTRTALASKQIWAARRNMNSPPRFTQVTTTWQGTISLADTVAEQTIIMVRNQQNSATVLATDQGDALSYGALFLAPWMSFSTSTRTLSGVPPQTGTFHVKIRVTTASGGTDSFILKVNVVVVPPLLAGAAQRNASSLDQGEGPNPTGGEFVVMAPVTRTQVTLSIFDVSGRRVAVINGTGGSHLVWDGTDGSGAKVGPGIYLYRMDAGRDRREGKIVVVR